jgi:hypothetical protein
MEASNLRTASVYINNLLLSRGLLRNGQEIDFAYPDKGEGGLEGTMGRVMSVVNDLVLRRDVGGLFFKISEEDSLSEGMDARWDDQESELRDRGEEKWRRRC